MQLEGQLNTNPSSNLEDMDHQQDAKDFFEEYQIVDSSKRFVLKKEKLFTRLYQI